LPIAPRLATASCWSGATSWAAYWLMLSRNVWTLASRSMLAKPNELLLPWRDDRGQVGAQRRQVRDEVLERGEERGGDQDGHDDETTEDQQVDGEDRARAGHQRDGGGAIHKRPEHEREEPGQEEDHDQVAEDREDRADERQDDEPERERAEHEDRVEPAAFPRRQLEAHRRLALPARAHRRARRPAHHRADTA
jgi:hypothetical protein